MPIPRVAVIAVHGVADQQPGDTARAVANLLVSSAPDKTCYASGSTAHLSLRVVPLKPQPDTDPDAAETTRATPDSRDRPLSKSFRQSLRSDFHSQHWAATAPPAAVAGEAPQDPTQVAAPPTVQDRGIAVTNYLLAKSIRNGAAPETYDTVRIELRRHDVAPDELAGDDDRHATAQVDVHEMYWADLSRLSGSMPRVVSELFTLVFRLSKLGRETVTEMWSQLARARTPGTPRSRVYAGAWNIVGWLQCGLDWLFVNGLALMFAQLALLDIVLVGLGYTAGLAPDAAADAQAALLQRNEEVWLHRGVAMSLGVLAALHMVYRRGERRWLPRLLSAGVLVVSGWALVVAPTLLQWVTALTLLALLTVANEFLLRVADDRFPLVHAVGRWMWAASALLMIASAVAEIRTGSVPTWRDVWIHAALFSTECALFAMKSWWIVAGPLLMCWFVAGQVARAESGYASRASIATGRLGLTVSLCLFLVVSMSLWSLATSVLDKAALGSGYRPCIFPFVPPETTRLAPSSPVNVCLWTSEAARQTAAIGPMPTAGAVLDDRYYKSTEQFWPLATLMLLLGVYVVAMVTPSVLAELKLLVNARQDAHQRLVDERHRVHARQTLLRRTQRARELGRWLTAGYRRLDLVAACVTALGAVLSLEIALLFLLSIFDSSQLLGFISDVGLLRPVQLITRLPVPGSDAPDLFQLITQAAVWGSAGAGLALSVLGNVFSRNLPSLRGPLDVAMDVDNHFREFPRTDIPRAHIFSRYAALLEHVRAQGYDRVVIVSHSQGTVISAELLRFLSSRNQLAPASGDTPRLPAGDLPPVSLLTLGCPLRQLYAARFPGLYAWVLALNGKVFGPRADDVGVQRWMNAFCSGDYVGRWLWSSAGPGASLAHPMVSALGHDPLGRADIYAGFDPARPADAALQHAREVEVCLGLGAHTHYFEPDQTTVAWMIDWLIRAHPPGDPGEVAGTEAGPVPTVDAPGGAPARVVPVQASVVSDGAPAPMAAPDAPAPAPSTKLR